jgi:hypothetical protein
MTPPRLRVRTRLLLTIVGALALGFAVAVGAFWLVLAQRLSTSATSLARAQARTEAASVQLRNGRLVLSTVSSNGPNPSPTWLFAGNRLLVAPRASARVQRAARALAGGRERWINVHGEVRLYAVPLIRNGVRYGTVVSAAPLDAYEETTRTTLVGAVLLAIVLLGIAAALSWWILGRVLQPVSQMTEDAAKWSENDLDRRFDLGDISGCKLPYSAYFCPGFNNSVFAMSSKIGFLFISGLSITLLNNSFNTSPSWGPSANPSSSRSSPSIDKSCTVSGSFSRRILSTSFFSINKSSK